MGLGLMRMHTFLMPLIPPNENHRFQFYALGAPQRHGQNRYRQNIATMILNMLKI